MIDRTEVAERTDFGAESQPPESGVVSALRRRPRVDAKIAEQFARYPIVVLAGAGGIGKSVALQDAFDSIGVAPTVIHALHESFASVMRSLVDHVAIGAPSEDRPSDESASDLSTWLTEKLLELGPVIVLEDLHLAAHDERFVLTLGNLVESTIPRTRWVLVTRTPEVLPIAKWIGQGHMAAVIDESILRFTKDEADSYLRHSLPFLSDQERSTIADMTDGWAALLALSTSVPLASLRQAQVPSASREAVFDYLAHEIFDQLAEPDQAFLLQTCLFPKIDDEFLWQHASIVDPRATVRRLQRRMPLIRDADIGSYYYHKLLQDFLKRTLRDRDEDGYVDNVRRAATICIAGSWNAAALDLYSEIDDKAGIEALLIERGLWMADHGESDVVKQALSLLPEVSKRHPIVRTLDAAFGISAGEGPFPDELFAEIWSEVKGQTYAAAICARYVRSLNDRRQAVHPDLISTMLSDDTLPSADRGRILGAIAMNFARLARVDDARRYLDQAWAIFKASPAPEEILGSTYLTHAMIAFQDGKEDVAASYASRARDIARRRHRYPLAAALESLAFDMAYSNGNLIEARRCAQEMFNYAIASGVPAHEQRALLHLMMVAAQELDEPEMERVAAALAEHAIVDEIAHARVMPVSLAFRSGAHGDFTSALEYVLDTEAVLEPYPLLYRSRCAHIAVFAAACGRNDLVERYLGPALGRVSVPGSRRDTLIILFCAIAALLTGRRGAAHRLIATAESKAARMGRWNHGMIAATRAFYCYILDPDQTTRGDFQRMNGILRKEGYVALALVLDQLMRASTTILEPEVRIAMLTDAERAVYALLATGLSNRAISNIRGTSSNTIKHQVASILSKLRLSGRKELAAYAASHRVKLPDHDPEATP